MFSIIRLRIMRLKDDFKIIILMSAIALLMIGGFAKAYSSAGAPIIVLVDEDKTTYSELMMNQIKEIPDFRFQIVDKSQARAMVNQEDAVSAFVLEKGFSKNLKEKQPVVIGVIQVKEAFETLTVKNALSGILNKMKGRIVTAERAATLVSGTNAGETYNEVFDKNYALTQKSWDDQVPIRLLVEKVGGQKATYDSLIHGVIGFALFFSTYSMVFGISEILNEKENFTWQRQLLSPISKSSMLIGNLLMTFLNGAINVGIIFIGGKYIFGMNWAGDLVDIMILLSAFVFCVTSLGLMMSTFIKSYAQLSAITPLVLTGSAMLGGCFWPIEIVSSKLLIFIAKLTPQYWAVHGLEKIAMFGFDIKAVQLDVIMLCLMGLVYLALGVFFMKNEA